MSIQEDPVTPPEPRPLEPERLRTMFRERGWSIVMDDRPGQSFDPFADIAAFLTPAAEAGPGPGLAAPCKRSEDGLLCLIHGGRLWPALSRRCNGWQALREPRS